MGEARVYIVTVDKHRPDKRQQLTSGIDVALVFDGARIRAGEYEVSIRHIGPAGTYVEPCPCGAAEGTAGCPLCAVQSLQTPTPEE